MGLWFRVHLGPFGYTRRSPQTYRQYKNERNRRRAYAARYELEQEQGSAWFRALNAAQVAAGQRRERRAARARADALEAVKAEKAARLEEQRTFAAEADWVSRVPAYIEALEGNVSAYQRVIAAAATEQGTSRKDYAESLDALLETPALADRTLGEPPSERTRLTLELLREQANAVQGWALNWDTYLQKNDESARTTADEFQRQLTELTDRINSRLAELRP